MVEEQKARLDDAMTKMLEEVDKSYIRIIQGKMFRCAAKCCEDVSSSMDTVQRCIQTCARPLESAEGFVKNEFSHFQDRLQRCVMTCNDTVRDKIGTETKELEINRYTKEFEGCAKKCVDTHLDLIPSLLKKIKETMKKENY